MIKRLPATPKTETTPLLGGDEDAFRSYTPSLDHGSSWEKEAQHTALQLGERDCRPKRRKGQEQKKGLDKVIVSRPLVFLVFLTGVLALAGVASRIPEDKRREHIDNLSAWKPFSALTSTSTSTPSSTRQIKHHKYAGSRQWPKLAPAPLALHSVLNHDTPQRRMRSQLKDGVRYMTSMAYGGHTNQFIGIQNMLFLAKITNRVGIVPTLVPISGHNGGSPTPMSTFYDLDRFRQETGVAALDLTQLKGVRHNESGLAHYDYDERMSCWSTSELAVEDANGPFGTDVHDIAVDMWALPPMARAANGRDVAFDDLRLFDAERNLREAWVKQVREEYLPQWSKKQREFMRKQGWPVPKTTSGRGNMKQYFSDPRATDPPSEQLMCIDNGLFAGALQLPEAYPHEVPLSPHAEREDEAWKEVGQHLHFNQQLESLADEYLVDLFDCGDASRIPPFLSIHLRRGDFKDFTGFTGLEKYISALTRVRNRLQKRLDDPRSERGPFEAHFRHFGIRADAYEVVVTTDEKPGSEFWTQVEEMGWKIIDHERMRTEERFDGWYPTMVDAAVLARGQGFVGTRASTFSEMSALRVKYWEGGVVERA